MQRAFFHYTILIIILFLVHRIQLLNESITPTITKNITINQTQWISTTKTTSTTTEFKCPYENYCSCSGRIYLICQYFDDFSDLKFFSNNSAVFKSVTLKPRRRQILSENSLNLTGLKLEQSGIVELWNIDQFYYGFNPFAAFSHLHIQLKIVNSKFQFVYDAAANRTLNSVCDSLSLSLTKGARSTTSQSLLSSVGTAAFESVEFVEAICPMLFENVTFTSFNVTDAAGGSQFRFQPLELSSRLPPKNVTSYITNYVPNMKPYKLSGLGSLIYYVFFKNVNFERIDSDVLNHDVFSGLKSVSFQNVYTRKIEPNVFQNFKYLKELKMELSNWQDLVDRVELQWMYDLNKQVEQINDVNKINKDMKFEFEINFGNYTLPDKDICKFRGFPLKKMVEPIIRSKHNCTCVVAWLLQYDPFGSISGIHNMTVTECVKNKTDTCQKDYDCSYILDFNAKVAVATAGRSFLDGLKQPTSIIIVSVVLSLVILFVVIVVVNRRVNALHEIRSLVRFNGQDVEMDHFI